MTSLIRARNVAAALCLTTALFASADEPLPKVTGARSASFPLGIVELRDDTRRVDLLGYSLVARELDAPNEAIPLGFEPDLTRFKALTLAKGQFLADASPIWLCFTLRGAASERSWLLGMGADSFDNLSVYIVDPEGKLESHGSDSASPITRIRRTFSECAFRLTIGPGQVKTVYLRFSSKRLVNPRVSLWDSFEYLELDELGSLLIGLVLGAILAVFLSTMFTSISLRETSFVYYLLYLVGLCFLVLSLSGVSFPQPHSASMAAAERSIPVFNAIADFGMLLFARRFLGIRRSLPAFSTVFLVVAALMIVYIPCAVVLDLRTMLLAGIAGDLASRILVLAVAAQVAAGGRRRKDWYFLVAWTFALVGVAISRLYSLGFVGEGSSPLVDKSEALGALIQILVFSYGITGSINEMRAEKEEGQRRSIELLERANNVKEDFIIGASLEFQSPLFGIIGLVDSVEALSAHRAGPEERRLLALVRAEAHRLLGSVENVATYARLRNDDLALSVERISLRELACSIAGSLAFTATGKDIIVENAVAEIEIETDGRILEQIVRNIFIKALNRSPSGTVILEGGARENTLGARAFLAVVDSAEALSGDTLALLRSPISLADKDIVGPDFEFLIARLLAERLDGSLTYSWAAEHGRIELDLPRRRESDNEEEPAVFKGRRSLKNYISGRIAREATVDLSETPPCASVRGTILVYDEASVFLEALKRFLEAGGYAVTPTVSADKAVELACSRRFDLILLDASSPGGSGLAACTRIRLSPGMGELPIVVMTDRESAGAIEAAFGAGASDYLPKLSPNELLFARVDTYVSLRRAINEALETRKKVAELEKLKTLGVLAAGVAHEVNTPNNAVIRNLPVISELWRELAPIVKRVMDESSGTSIRGWSSEEILRELPELLADTYNAGLQIKKIVEDLKDYARDTSASPPEAVDVSSSAAYAARLLSPLVNRSTTRFTLLAPAGLPLVRANSQKITQVAVSILENALQALPGPDATVILRTRCDEKRSRLILECEDKGVGIAPGDLARVFEPFFTTKQDSGGTGLGLSVALGIVRDAGGDIEIDSEIGKGTTVRVVLPAIADRESEGDERRT